MTVKHFTNLSFLTKKFFTLSQLLKHFVFDKRIIAQNNQNYFYVKSKIWFLKMVKAELKKSKVHKSLLF